MRQLSLVQWGFFSILTGVVYTIFMGGSFAAERPAPADLERWVRELNDESYKVREAATKELVAAGTPAVEVLAQAVLSDSAEVSWRANSSLKQIAARGDETTLNRISDALSKLKSQRPNVVKLAREVKTQQQKYRHDRAITKIRGLGGNLSGNWQDGRDDAIAELAVAEMAVGPMILVEDAPIDDVPVIEVEVGERPAPRGIFGLLARLIVPELAPPAAPEPLELPPDFAPAPLAPAAELARIAEIETAPEAPATPPEAELPSFEVPELPADAPAFLPRALEADLRAPPAPIVERIVEAEAAAEPAVEVVEGDVAEAIAVDVVEFGFAGPAVFFGDEEMSEGADYAELVLDKSFKGSDADLAVLKDIPELYSLSIKGAKVSDGALEHIAALPRLTTLELSGTDMSAAALHKLRKKRPELSIICRSSAMLGINAGLEGPCILTSVFYKSGAHDAGLTDGDEIIEVNGHKIRDFSDLTIAVYPHKAGEKLAVKYIRAGKERQALVTLKPRVAVESQE